MELADAVLAPWPPAFSEEFLASVRQRFADSDHVMIVGPLGSNRGALATAITGSAVAAVWGRDAHSSATPGARYACLNSLLPTLRARDGDSIADVISASEKILDRSFGRQVLTLREADLCDDGTVDVLAALVEDRRVSLVSTVGPAAAENHLLARSASRIDLTPLDEDSIAHLLGSRFGASAHPTTVSMLAARSQGAYGVLKALADAGFRTGQIKVLADTLVTDAAVSIDDVDDAAQSASTPWPPRFSPDHPARDLIDVAALTAALHLDEAHDTFGSEAVRAATASGAVLRAGRRLVFGSRVEAAIIARDLSVERRTALYERYAGRLRETALLRDVAPRLASWFTSADRPLTADLAVRAATQANRECRYADALAFLSTIPSGERTSRMLIEQCHALSESGAADELAALLDAIDPTTLHGDDLFPYLRWTSDGSGPGGMAATIGSIRRHADEHDDDHRRAVLTLGELHAEVHRHGGDDVRRALQSLAMSGRLSPVNHAMAQVALAASLRHASRAEQAVEVATKAVDLLVEAGDDAGACNVELALETRIMCHISAGDLESAREALTIYSGPGVPFGNLGRLGTALWGFVSFFHGDVRAALALAQLCLARLPDSDPHRVRSWVEAISAQVLSRVGDVEQVEALLQASYSRPRSSRLQHDLECRIAQACAHDAIAEPEEALQILQEVVDEAHEHQLRLEEVDAAVLCVQIGGPVHLPQLLRAVDGLDETSGTSAIWQRFAWAIRDNDMRGLVALAEELDLTGRQVLSAEVAQFTLDIARRAADMTPEQRQRLGAIADPMQHRTVTR